MADSATPTPDHFSFDEMKRAAATPTPLQASSDETANGPGLRSQCLSDEPEGSGRAPAQAERGASPDEQAAATASSLSAPPQAVIEAAARVLALDWFEDSGTPQATQEMVDDLAENYCKQASRVLAAAAAHPEFLAWALEQAGYTHTTQSIEKAGGIGGTDRSRDVWSGPWVVREATK